MNAILFLRADLLARSIYQSAELEVECGARCAAQSSRVVVRHLSLPSPVLTAGYLKCSLTHEVIGLSSKTAMRNA